MTALETALNLLDRGFWPVPITPIDDDGPSPGKRPLGEGWGEKRHSKSSLRSAFRTCPDAGVGLVLGPKSGIVDLEVEDRATGDETLVTLLGGECFETLGWDSERGPHLIFKWDERLLQYKNILKGDQIPGVELRFGHNGQFQSVCPPSPSISGRKREWNGVEEIASLPDCFFEALNKLFPAKPKATSQKAAKPSLPLSNGTNGISVEDRARRYLEKLPEAVEGQRGHDRIYHAACVLVDGFALSYQEALPILREWNTYKAVPPESEKQITHKLTDALKNTPRSGHLLNDHQIYSSSKNGHAKSEPTPWDHPVLDQAIPADPFPVDVFPPELGWFINEGARCLTCPPDFLATAVLAVAGAAIGRSLALIVKDSWVESPSLYAALVAKPGATKSPALNLISRPLWAITEKELSQHRNEMERRREDKKRMASERKQRQAAGMAAVALAEEPMPALRRIAVNDTTCEALAPILADNPRGLIMVRDELTAWVTGLNQYKSGGKGSDRQFFLSAWSGAAVTVDRKSQQDRGPIHIPHPFLSVVGAMTPEMLCELSDAKNRDDGFIDRLLFTLPDPVRIRWTPHTIPTEALKGWDDAVQDLWARPMTLGDGGRPRPLFVRFTPEALSVYAAWFDAHCEEAEELDFPHYLDGAWSKMRAYCARLALIVDQLWRAYDPTCADTSLDVSAVSARAAVQLITYYKNHCRRVKALLRGIGEDSSDARAIIKWAQHGQRQCFSERDAARNFPGRFRDNNADLGAALDWLRTRSCIRLLPEPPRSGPGRPPSRVYEVNPELLN